MRKILVVSSWAPPMAGGSTVILRQLLGEFPPSSYTVLTDRLSAFAGLPSGGWLPADHFFLGSQRRYSASQAAAAIDAALTPCGASGMRTMTRMLSRVSNAIDINRKLGDLESMAIRVIETEHAEIVLAPSSDPVYVVAAARAARATDRPLYVHLFDLFARNRYTISKRYLAARTEADILRQAQYIFVPNQAMASYYSERLGVTPVVIPNATLIPPASPLREVSNRPTILYTGAIYWAQRDAVKNLVVALRQLPEVTLEVRTRASNLELTRAGLRRGIPSEGFGSQELALQAQRNADLLFLPLGFKTSAQDVIHTAFPAKTAEYMTSGVPILVHAPRDSYISQYARDAKWGYVVDTPDPNALVAAVTRLLSEHRLRAELVDAAFSEAEHSHDLQKVRSDYERYFA